MAWIKGAMIGKGSFGTVNLATSLKNCHPQTMAVKSALLSKSSSLHNEKEILSHLNNCPQIVRSLGDDITTENGDPVYNLFLEYVSGGSLADLLKKSGGRLPESDVRRYVKSILLGLHYIHEKGFVHCDIKLQNLLVSSSGAKIADFGSAKLAGKNSLEKGDGFRLRGTPLYMSPESVCRSEYEPPVDIWSLGCAVAEMVSGKPAWRCPANSDANGLLFRIGFGDELPEIPTEVSELGRDFLSKCFVKDPAKRWTAEMLLRHPFVYDVTEEDPFEEKVNSSSLAAYTSPRSAFDFPEWTEESYVVSGGEFNLQKASCSSPVNRIEQLATGKTRPNWSSDSVDGWINVRKADSPVSALEEEIKKETVQVIDCTSEEACSVSDSAVVLEMMMGDGERLSTSSGFAEDLTGMNPCTNSASEKFLSSFTSSQSISEDQSDKRGGAACIRNSSKRRSGRMHSDLVGRISGREFSSSDCRLIFLHYFGDTDCIDSSTSKRYKQSSFI